ncbi:MAG: Ig-like domain-containing protein, partial [Bacteroidales bacterium]|nr:Ig-like domain-containing protein [Bacteroidales bacterium]
MKKTEVLSGMVVLLLACAMSFTSCKKEVESLSVEPVSIVLAIGEEYPLAADVRPKKAPQDVEWYTTNPHVASVDENGVVTALKIGVCNIKLYAGASASACQVTVVRKRVEHYFTVNGQGGKVLFSPGNLQYQASTNTWRFAEHQYDYVGDGGNHAGNVPGS